MAGGPEIEVELRNKYWVLRHGRSIPNHNGIIVSHLSNGVLDEYGLATAGFAEAKAAGELFLKEVGVESDNVRIYCSPFSRTKDTAQAVAEVLGFKTESLQVQVVEELRERYFGPELELQSHDHYPEIWALDEHDPTTGPAGGESVSDVANRVSKILQKLETDCQGCNILLVSHGDTLQILQTVINAALLCYQSGEDSLLGALAKCAFGSSVLSKHRRYSMHTAELRRLI